MFLRIKSFISLVVFCLVGCAPQTIYLATNPQKNERLSSVEIVFQRPPTIAMFYDSHLRDRNGSVKKNAVSKLDPLVKALEDNVAPQLSAALLQKGIARGPDATIYLRPISGQVMADTGTLVLLEVTVQSSDRSSPAWVAKIIDGSEVGYVTAEQNAQTFTDRIVFELVKAGFIAK